MNICRFRIEKLWKLNPQTEISGFFFGIQTQKPGGGAVKYINFYFFLKKKSFHWSKKKKKKKKTPKSGEIH
jgi:hypothetical protein